MFETPEQLPKLKVEVYPEFQGFVPAEFVEDPFRYFETYGKNIKPGETEFNEDGSVKEDPLAVKDFPIWVNQEGKKIKVVAKRVNTDKAMIKKGENPFHEVDVMKRVRAIGLPAPAPIAKIQKENEYLILMERARGITIFDKELDDSLDEHGYTEQDKQALKQKAEQAMVDLKIRFDEAGIKRKWKLTDMVFQVDFANKEIIGITPVDWERTEIVEE